jgi:uncharacterized membrane protein YidH (DUF202 family)
VSVEVAAKRAGKSSWIEGLGRLGLVAKGASFLLVGVLAALVAVHAGGEATDRQGALRLIGSKPYGTLLLILIAIGFAAYAVWRFAQALLDRDDEGNDAPGLAKRLSDAGKGVLYAGLAWIAVSFVTGARGESAREPEQTERVFNLPLGRWIVGAIGIGVIVAGLWNGYRSISRQFRKDMRTEEMDEEVEWWMNAVGVVGHAARMVVFCLVGYFVAKAAYEYDPNEAIGVDGALAKLARQPHGGYWLGAVAAGLIAYGVFCLFQARYRRV